MLGDGVVYRGDDDESVFVVTALESDVDHFRRSAPTSTSTSRSGRLRFRTCSCRARARASS